MSVRCAVQPRWRGTISVSRPRRTVHRRCHPARQDPPVQPAGDRVLYATSGRGLRFFDLKDFSATLPNVALCTDNAAGWNAEELVGVSRQRWRSWSRSRSQPSGSSRRFAASSVAAPRTSGCEPSQWGASACPFSTLVKACPPPSKLRRGDRRGSDSEWVAETGSFSARRVSVTPGSAARAIAHGTPR
jgi:hypothetical protein